MVELEPEPETPALEMEWTVTGKDKQGEGGDSDEGSHPPQSPGALLIPLLDLVFLSGRFLPGQPPAEALFPKAPKLSPAPLLSLVSVCLSPSVSISFRL